MGRPPYKIDVTANQGSLSDIPMGFNFIVILNVFTYGFQEVSGLSMKRPMGSHEEGGVNDHVIVVGQPSTDLRELTFRRGMLIKKNKIITDAARMGAALLSSNTARKSALLAVSALDASISLEQGPSVGFLQIFDRKFKSEIATFSFFALGMSEWRLNDLDSQSNNLLIEEFTIVHTGLKRITDNPTPTFISGFLSSDTYNSESYQTGSEYIDNSQMKQNDAKRREEFLEQSKNNDEKPTPSQNADVAIDEAKVAAENARKAAEEIRIAQLEKRRTELAQINAEIAQIHAEDETRRKEIQEIAAKAREENEKNSEKIREKQKQAAEAAKKSLEAAQAAEAAAGELENSDENDPQKVASARAAANEARDAASEASGLSE